VDHFIRDGVDGVSWISPCHLLMEPQLRATSSHGWMCTGGVGCCRA